MKYLHYFPYEKFTLPYIQFINENYSSEDHLFVLYGDKVSYSVENYENIIEFEKSLKFTLYLLKAMFKSKKIIMHSLNGYLTFLLMLQPCLLKKCFWIVWGGDLYNFNICPKSIKNKIKTKIMSFAINRMHGIGTLVKGDYRFAEKKFKLRGKYYPAAYINPIKTEYLDGIYNKAEVTEEVINIQIGNSADKSNRHIEVLNSLVNYKEKNIKIYAPLSYSGTPEYIEEVKNHGNKLFGKKFFPIVEFLTPEKYTDFLKKVNIAIFGNKRQQALGNIFALAYLNKKIYIRNDISTWEYLTEEVNIKLFNYRDIKNESFEEFSNLVIESDNKKNIVKVLDIDGIKKKWDNIFE